MILNFPWFVRFGIDFTAIMVPIWVICSIPIFNIDYPRLFTYYLNNKRRLERKRGNYFLFILQLDYTEINLGNGSGLTVDQVVALKKDYGFRD